MLGVQIIKNKLNKFFSHKKSNNKLKKLKSQLKLHVYYIIGRYLAASINLIYLFSS
jgi:hypothetical protein